VGWAGDPRIEDGAFDAIYAFTAGIPRRINMVCNRLLLAGFLNEKHMLDADDVELVAGEIKEELGFNPSKAVVADEQAGEAQAGSSRESGGNGSPRSRPAAPDAAERAYAELLPRVARRARAVSLLLGPLRRAVSSAEPLEKPAKEFRP
jgi:general secretion pathway protein A